jgi:AraC-like DNA-binding protein
MKAVKNIYIIGVLAVLAIVGCGRGVDEKNLSHDEVRAINAWVLEKAINQPDSALMMIERLRGGDLAGIDTTGLSVRVNGPLPDYRCDYLRVKVYAQSLEGMWLDSAIIIGERLMTTDAAREDLAYRQDVLEMLINACRQHRDDELTIHWSAQLIDLCRQNGDETEALRTEADLGLMLSGIGRADEGLAKIDSVIALLRGKRKFNELDATIIALKRKVNVLKTRAEGQEVRGERIVDCARQMLDLMADYEQHPDEYHDGTYREPPEHLRPGYIDFYRAQAYMFMAEAEAKAGNKAEARKYLSLFEQTDYAKTFMARKDFAPIYGLLGEYEKMLAIHDEQEARLRQQGDTVNAEYATILRDRAMAAEARGRHAEANAYHRRYEALTATLNDRLLQGKANLYAARFHAAEQQREIERHKARAKYLSIVGSYFAVVAVMALLFAAYVVHKRRIVDQKNRALVKQIAEAAEYRKRYDIQTAEVSTPLSTRRGAGGEAILQVIKEKKLYLDPQFDRQAASDYFQITARDVGAAFAQGSEYANITDFINRLRLDHARELMTTRPDMSIDEVATASGFSVRRTFSRLFKEKFGLTPTEYRAVYLSGIDAND